jgi:hypothetical protein
MAGVLEKRGLFPFQVLAHVLERRTQQIAQRFAIVVAPALAHVAQELLDFERILTMALVLPDGEFDQPRNRQGRLPDLQEAIDGFLVLLMDDQITREVALALCREMMVEPSSKVISQPLEIVAQPMLPLSSFQNERKCMFGIRIFGIDRAHLHPPSAGDAQSGTRSYVYSMPKVGPAGRIRH